MKLKLSNLSRSITYALASSATVGLFSTTALANETEGAKKDIEKIAVVGSRAAPRSVGDSPVPIDIIGGDEIAKAGGDDMLELLKGSVPSLNVHQTLSVMLHLL